MLQSFTLTGDRVVTMVGDFLRYDNDASQAIRVRADGQDFGLLWPGEAVELPAPVDVWEIKGPADGVQASGVLRLGIGRIRTSRRAQTHRPPVLVLESGIGQVAAGAGPGWVSGDPASMAAGATVEVVFDLGPDWHQYGLLGVVLFSTAPAAQFANVTMTGGDGPAFDARRRMNYALSTTSSQIYVTNATTASSGIEVTARPKGRYVIVRCVNDAANAQGSAARVGITVYPT